MKPILTGFLTAPLLSVLLLAIPGLLPPVHGVRFWAVLGCTALSGGMTGALYTVTRAVRNRVGLQQAAGWLATLLTAAGLFAAALQAGLQVGQ